jgi:hypothetical protein
MLLNVAYFSSSSCFKQVTCGLVIGAALFLSPPLYAASCCGGGSASSLVLPKFFTQMFAGSFNFEQYDGFWNTDGIYTEDPPGSDLNQYRLNLGYGHRLAPNWQASVVVPYVWNNNTYSGLESNTSGLGDMSLSLWYETFDQIMCVYDVRELEDLMPAVYLGTSLTLPTGKSPYGSGVSNSFDITGRGFYRLDANLLLDKTIWPWTMIAEFAYGVHLERPVNQEYGRYVEPYDKQLGNRRFGLVSLGYTAFLEELDTLTFTLAYSDLKEDLGTINGATDPTSGMRKKSFTFTTAYSTPAKDWVVKGSVNHSPAKNDWGRNFPVTNIFAIELIHVIP